MLSRTLCVILCVLLAAPDLGWSQNGRTAPFALTVDNIMRGPGLYGYPPRAVRWSGDSRRVFFEWKRYDEPLDKEYSTYVVNRDGSNLRKLTEEETKDAPPQNGDETRDWKLTVYADDGDLFLYDNLAGETRRLTRTAEAEAGARFTQDEERIAFTRANNLYVLSPREGSIEQLTDIRPSSAPPDEPKKGTDSQEFLKKEERELLAIVRERAEKREHDEAEKKKENPRKPFRLAARQSVQSLRLAPDESYVAALILERGEGTKNAIVPNFVTESGYTTDIPGRAKVGDSPPTSKLALLNVKSGEVKWFAPGIKEKDKPRAIRVFAPQWSPDGSRAIVYGLAADNKDAWIFALHPTNPKGQVLVHLHDDAWVRASFGNAGWLDDNRRYYYLSERDGWSHLYTVDVDSGKSQQLTSGKWEVRGAKLTQDHKQFLLVTSEVHPGEDHAYLMGLDGGVRKRLTEMPGGNEDVELSPDGTTLATVYSYINKPPELYLKDLRTADAKPVKVTDSPAPDFWNYPWLDAPLVEIPARDGARVPARIYKPANWQRGGPLVVFVHGAGYLQNAHKHWSSYSREYLFHHLLRERGFLVLDADYRASAGYGRDWRTAIYRHMGGKDLDDQVDAVKWAIAEYGVDPKRVGLYGGSYGGFITLMAMFTQPDVFAAGAALRPVTDWAHYNNGYTSNILNMPQKDEEAYRQSSPIYFAEGLKGALLICHGMVDTNVHFQDTVRLVQRLIELRKENWELAVFPAEDHGFVHPSSWADEYKRILKLFETNLGARK